ncbi:MAG: VCBS repeat-containing protein [Phycisphaerae bacterium]|nr:VCBS repeat-containing protein [Phycisphaerae bacterium]
MSDSSSPSESWRAEWKYVGIRKDALPRRDGNRSLYHLRRILQLVLVLGLGIHEAAWPGEQPSFTNITETSGIARLVNDHYTSNPTWWLSGLHLVDLDGDGDLDLFLSAHGKGDTLAVLNDGFGHFARASGKYPRSEIHLCYDSDEDGKVDLTMTYQDGGGQWWRNRSRSDELLFEPTGITRGTNTARRQAMIDINRDGKVDWLRGTDTDIRFDFGDGKGFFSEGSHRLPVTRGRDEILCLPHDIDGDGDIDLLAEWGHYSAPEGNCRIFRNDGAMTFTDVTAEAGLPKTGTAIKGVGDVDHDGDPDLICLERRHFQIYLNDGARGFVKKVGAILGIGKGASSASWGIAVTTDFDNDGVADVLVNGKYFLKILRGTGGGSFEYANSAWGIADVSAASIDDGLCFGDIDADGDLDIVGYTSISGQRRFAVYRNDLPARNWLRIRLIGSHGNRGAAGAKIRIYTHDEGRLLWYEQVAIYDSQAAASYYALSVTERHFGLGQRKIVDVSVEFYPSQSLVWRRGVTANGPVEIVEQPASPQTR